MSTPSATVMTSLTHGIKRRCPRCGEGPLFRKWFTMHHMCDHCGLRYEQNAGDTWALWLIGDRLFIGILIIAVFLIFRTDNPWLATFLMSLTVLPLILTMPHRMGLCVAVDFLVRDRWGDLSHEAPKVVPPQEEKRS